MVRVEAVSGQADNLDAAVGEVGLAAGNLSELGRADRGEVVGVREEDRLEPLSVRDQLWHLARSTYP